VDDVLRQGVQGISDLITKPGVVNVDFADVSAVMQDSGSALMGIGVASGEDRARQAAKSAINSPLLDVSIDGAKGVLFNISGSDELTMMEVNEAAEIITESIDTNARIIFGASVDDSLKKGEVRITVVATGFDLEFSSGETGEIISPQKKIRLTEPEIEEEEEKFKLNDDFSAERMEAKKNNNLELKTVKRKIKKDDKEEKKQLIIQDEEKTTGEDDLEIPAFIRKKLGK